MVTKACIFDFDGTVIDSEKYHYIAWREVANAVGTDISYEEYLPFKSAGRRVVIPYLFNKAGKTLTENLYDKFHTLRQERILLALSSLNESDIMPGVINYVRFLKSKGIKCAVASSSAAAHVTAERFGIFDLFDAFIDGEANLPNKPNPDLFLAVAKMLNVKPVDCVVFEDSINGLKAGKNANMKVIGFQTHFTDIADRIIDDFSTATLDTVTF